MTPWGCRVVTSHHRWSRSGRPETMLEIGGKSGGGCFDVSPRLRRKPGSSCLSSSPGHRSTCVGLAPETTEDLRQDFPRLQPAPQSSPTLPLTAHRGRPRRRTPSQRSDPSAAAPNRCRSLEPPSFPRNTSSTEMTMRCVISFVFLGFFKRRVCVRACARALLSWYLLVHHSCSL